MRWLVEGSDKSKVGMPRSVHNGGSGSPFEWRCTNEQATRPNQNDRGRLALAPKAVALQRMALAGLQMRSKRQTWTFDGSTGGFVTEHGLNDGTDGTEIAAVTP